MLLRKLPLLLFALLLLPASSRVLAGYTALAIPRVHTYVHLHRY